MQDTLTYLQKAAIKGEVAMLLTTSPHDAEIKYRLYTILKEIPKEHRALIIQTAKEAVTFDESIIDRLVLEIENKQVPVWLWIEKAIADLKIALTVSESNGAKISINKSTEKKHIVTSAFIMFVRNAALMCPDSAIKLCYAVEEEFDLDFLKTACFELTKEVEDLKKSRVAKSLPNPDIMGLDFDIREIMSFKIEMESPEDLVRVLSEPEKIINEVKSKLRTIMKTSDSKVQGEIKPKQEVAKKAKYVVMKTFNGSHLTQVVGAYETEEEAIEFVKDIEDSFPEIKKTCTFEIIKRQVKS